MTSSIVAVITTISEPTVSVKKLVNVLGHYQARLVVVGDNKGPARFDLAAVEFLSLADQLKLPFFLASLLPIGHYARKNIGYLVAICSGATCIYETDDDNAPSDSWATRSLHVTARRAPSCQWYNVYRYFSEDLIWPRGFPLRFVRTQETCRMNFPTELEGVEAPIQQGLVNGSPDVDAIWRLVLDRDFNFCSRESIWLPPGTWCSFNSQSTWWWPVVYPLLYLPSYCSFRMTDIWRSFIAQRCLWELGLGVVFHAAEVIQMRNVHDLMRDFNDEIPGYRGNEELAGHLSATELKPGIQEVGQNLFRCYERLTGKGFFPSEELRLVEAWLRDFEAIQQTAGVFPTSKL